jgi:ABC-type sugar transport system substrate-binding protein
LNSLSYGWWLNNTVYRFNDPDHIKLAGTTDNEARSRVNSGVIAGTVFLDGDNFHNEQAQELAVKLLTQPEVNRIARLGLSFRPLDDVDGGKAAEWFVLHQGEEVYVAVFNYNPLEPSNKIMEAVRLGLKANTSYILQDVWERSSLEFKDKIDVKLKPTESKLFRIVMPTK